MRTLILFFILLISFSLLFAQNNAPEVTNVNFNQRTDGSFIVDVYYDLNDADNDTMFVTMQVSEDSGATWSFSCDSISGDKGADILSGTGKQIIWNFGTEHPQTFGDGFRISIIANDRDIEPGIVTDIDGNIYKTVKIGNQWWMAENLKTTRYRNSDIIPQVTDDTIWAGLSSGAWCNYNNDTTHVATYGRMYNWYAVDSSSNLAPKGWHVPTDEEWKELEIFLGMSQAQANGTNYRGTDEADKMKEAGTVHWYNPSSGTNSSGFSALPGGDRADDGTFLGLRFDGPFWSATEASATNAWYRALHYNSSQVRRLFFNKRDGFYVRCVKD